MVIRVSKTESTYYENFISHKMLNRAEDCKKTQPPKPCPGCCREPRGPKGAKGEPGAELRPTTEDDYLALPEEQKRRLDVLWIIYPDDFFEVY